MIFAWLPRALVAVPVGSSLCLGTDHITLDCHEQSEHNHPCDEEENSTPNQTCVDMVSFATSAPAKVSHHLFDAELIALLPPPSQLVLCCTFIALPRGGDDPPGFAARAFASCISLRR